MRSTAGSPLRCTLTLVALTCVLGACGPLPPPQQAKELVVVTRAGPTTYLADSDGRVTGFEHDLALLFGEYLKLPVRFVIADTLDELRGTLTRGRAHVAAAGLYREDAPAGDILFGPPYQDSRPVLVYNTDQLAPRDWDDVRGKTVAVPQVDPAQKNLLQALRALNTNVIWQAFPTANEDSLIEKVAEGETAYAIADATVLSVVRNLYLDVDDAFPVAQTQQFAWAFPVEMRELRDQAATFFAKIKQDGTLQRLQDRYYGHIDRIEAVDAGIFRDRITDRLPRLRAHFQHAQEMTGTDWRLLAAIAYAESHWDELATSRTNVRGIMMLTEDTAQRMKVIDRLDARQSIIAGARYFVDVKRALPARITEPDRTWIALAAYNIGLAHLEDARVLAQKRKLNPDVWADLKKTLPLLAKPEYAKQAKHGFAHGGAPVVFVENIRAYYDILSRIEKPYWYLRVESEAGVSSPAATAQAQR